MDYMDLEGHDLSENKKDSVEDIKVTLEPGQFDLETHLANYSGNARIQRLLFIGDKCPQLSLSCWKQAVVELKQTARTASYRALVSAHGEAIGEPLDSSWIESKDRQAAVEFESLENRLNTAKTNAQREDTRNAYIALGDYHYKRGELDQALKSYGRTREHMNPDALLSMCLLYIRASLENRSFPHAQSYITKAESALQKEDKGVYKMAARKFLQVTADIGQEFNDVLSQQDIAIYACICALATFDRPELQRLLLQSGSFRNLLEQIPDIRELLNDFYNSRYSSVLAQLDRLKPVLLLDINLHSHVNRLYKMIRDKALVQYFTPYSSVDMKQMAAAFNTTLAELETDVTALILDSTIKARIDSQNQRLHAKSVDQRTQTFEETLQMGDEFLLNTQMAILRMNMARSDFRVAPPRPRVEDRQKAGNTSKEEKKRGKPE